MTNDDVALSSAPTTSRFIYKLCSMNISDYGNFSAMKHTGGSDTSMIMIIMIIMMVVDRNASSMSHIIVIKQNANFIQHVALAYCIQLFNQTMPDYYRISQVVFKPISIMYDRMMIIIICDSRIFSTMRDSSMQTECKHVSCANVVDWHMNRDGVYSPNSFLPFFSVFLASVPNADSVVRFYAFSWSFSDSRQQMPNYSSDRRICTNQPHLVVCVQIFCTCAPIRLFTYCFEMPCIDIYRYIIILSLILLCFRVYF